MKRVYKVAIWVILSITVFFAVLNFTLSIFAKRIIIEQIEDNLKIKTSLSKVNITLPFKISLIKLKAGDLFYADQISVSPNFLGLLAGKIVFSKVTLINPVIALEQSSTGKMNIPQLKSNGKQPKVYLTGLAIRNGRVIFTDKKVDPKGFKAILSGIDADVSKDIFPVTSTKVNFKVSADFLNAGLTRIGDIALSGWINFMPKDMEATLKLRDLELTYFQPYYGDFISSRNLLFAKLNLTTTLNSQNNDLEILTGFKLSDLTYAPEDILDTQKPSLDLTKNALDLFTDAKGDLNLEFKVKTKLDSPDISMQDIRKIILRAAAKNLASQNPADLIKKVSDNIEQFKDFGKEMKRIFKGKE